MAAKRIFVQNNWDGTFSVVYDDGQGNFEELDRRTDQQQAEQIAIVFQETRLGRPPAQQSYTPPPTPAYNPPAYSPPPAPSLGGGFPTVGGTAQVVDPGQQLQQEYLRQRLKELEIPGLDLQRRAQILSEIQNYSNLTGYVDPNMWSSLLGGMGGSSGTGSTPTGNYNTIHGTRTIQQMRQELVNASGGMDQWKNAGDDAVLSEYAKITGGAVNPIMTGGSSGGGDINPFTGERMNTLERDKFEEIKRQFDAQQQQQNEQFYSNMLSGLSGPRDWIKYQIAQSQVPESARTGNLASIFGATPAFGAMTPGASWEQAWMGQGNNAGAGQGYLGPPVQEGGQGQGYLGPPVVEGGAGGSVVGAGGPLPPTVIGGNTFPVSYIGPAAETVGPTSTGSIYGSKGPPVSYLGPPASDGTGSTSVTGSRIGGPLPPVAETVGGSVVGRAGPMPPQVEATGSRTTTQPPVSYLGPPVKEGTGTTTGSKTPWYGQFVQPSSIGLSNYLKMTPTQKEMLSGQVSAYGVDPGDFWSRVQAGFPTGSRASTRTTWR